MRHIIWRNRASAILGLLVMIMPFTGFPEPARDSLIVLFGFFIVLFGFYYGGKNYRLKEGLVSLSVPSQPTKAPRRPRKIAQSEERVEDIVQNEPSN